MQNIQTLWTQLHPVKIGTSAQEPSNKSLAGVKTACHQSLSVFTPTKLLLNGSSSGSGLLGEVCGWGWH